MHTSKVTQKFQTTIPSNIREFLNINEGDRVAFEIDKDKVIIKKIKPLDIEYLRSLDNSLTEWSSLEDDEAYRDL
jgi:AbrB family looped-hinge helix DNA binding protein